MALVLAFVYVRRTPGSVITVVRYVVCEVIMWLCVSPLLIHVILDFISMHINSLHTKINDIRKNVTENESSLLRSSYSGNNL